MNKRTTFIITIGSIGLALAGCAAPHAGQTLIGDGALSLACPSTPAVPNASYVGAYRGVENNLASKDYAQDMYCAALFKAQKYPRGFVTIYGSSRIAEVNTKGDAATNTANDRLYKEVRSFAYRWTQRFGAAYPIMTGAGPGLMEAGSRGARDAGPSIGYTTYYDPKPPGDSPHAYGGNPARVFWKHAGQEIITDGLIFTSVAMRETAMILHSAAVILAPGGTGTEWEAFQIIETIKSRQLTRVPIYVVGNREMHWRSFDARLNDMVKRGTINEGEVTQYIEYVDNAEDVVERLRLRLGL